MSNLRELKRRIKAVKSTAQVTRAMQLVAASKMKRAQQNAIATRPYTQLLAEFFLQMPEELFANHALLAPRAIKKRGIVIIAPEKGLCGGLITNLNKEILRLPADATYIAIGRRAAATLMRLRRNMAAEFHLSDRCRFAELRGACELMLKMYQAGEVDSFEVLYSSFVSALKQEPTVDQLLPLTNLQSVLDSFKKDYTANAPIKDDNRPFIIEPSPAEVLEGLIPLFIKQEFFHTALEAKASEHSARMVAMKSATDNAKGLADGLTLTFNKARQAAITQEIVELSSAAAAG